MRILVVNGPNINMLGIREKNIYGSQTYQDLIDMIREWAKELDIEITCYQSNHEGEIVDTLQQAYFDDYDGIVINPAAYTHTSVAILDALKAINIPAVEVHISKVEERENFRQISYVREYCFKTITGLGFEGYHQALIALKEKIVNK